MGERHRALRFAAWHHRASSRCRHGRSDTYTLEQGRGTMSSSSLRRTAAWRLGMRQMDEANFSDLPGPSIVQSRRCACSQGTHSMTLKRLLQRTKVAHSGYRSRSQGGPTSQRGVDQVPRQSSHYEQRGGNIGEGSCGNITWKETPALAEDTQNLDAGRDRVHLSTKGGVPTCWTLTCRNARKLKALFYGTGLHRAWFQALGEPAKPLPPPSKLRQPQIAEFM